MARFVSLINWTELGAKNISETVQRAEAAQKLAAEMGGSIELLWTMGEFDIVAISQFADDETAVKFLAKVSAQGAIRTRTMRAFEADEIRGLMA